jgi:iron complex outermembrane receptor protein
VESSALSKYRPETVNSGTFTDMPPEKLPCVVDTLTEDFIREHNPTDLNDLLRHVPGIETGGTSLLVRQPGIFTIRGKGGTEPSIDGLYSVGRGPGLFMDPFLMERVEIVKGPIASLAGGSCAASNANGAGGSINMYLKGARLDKDEVSLQENTSVGKHTFRQRGMADANETFLDGKGAVRIIGTADYYEPAYIHQGSQNGARGRESYTAAPSFVFQPNDEVRFGIKTMFQYVDTPSYIGVPVWRGRPGGGYGWYESSCRPGDRQHYEGMLVNPWIDWQVSENWLLKFGGAFQFASMDQTTREPYSGTGAELNNYFKTGIWSSGNKYRFTGFSNSSSLLRTYSTYGRSIYGTELDCGLENSFLAQLDACYSDGNAFSSAYSRYGTTLQDTISWGWVTLLGGVRYDFVHLNDSAGSVGQDGHGVSPRGGLSIQPIDWLVFFGNISQTRTPMLSMKAPDGKPLTKPWYATQIEGGARIKTFERLWLSASVYRIEQENTPSRIGTTMFYEQEGRNTSRGAELSLSGDITDDWTMMAMYSHNRYTDRTVSSASKGRDFERYPTHTATLSTSYRISSGPLEDIVFGCSFRYRSMSYATVKGMFVDKNLRFDPSYLFDANVSMPLSKFGGPENWTLSFGIRNLFGERYFDTARHYYECLVGEPRTFEIGLRAKF